MKFKLSKKIIIIIATLFITSVQGSIEIFNKSSRTIQKEEIRVHSTAPWCPDSKNPMILSPKTGHYTPRYEGNCKNISFDYFEINGTQFNIQSKIPYMSSRLSGSPRVVLEIFDDAIYLNGYKAYPSKQ